MLNKKLKSLCPGVIFFLNLKLVISMLLLSKNIGKELYHREFTLRKPTHGKVD